MNSDTHGWRHIGAEIVERKYLNIPTLNFMVNCGKKNFPNDDESA